VGIAAVVVLARSRLRAFERTGWIAGAAGLLFVLPVAVHGFARWDEDSQRDAYALTPGLVSYLRTHLPERSVVYADLETSYRISAYVPVYVATAPPTHVADTRANRPADRRRDLLRFLRTGNLVIPRHYHAGWLVLRRHQLTGLRGHVVYRDATFRVIRL
jgi:hypothetical protein